MTGKQQSFELLDRALSAVIEHGCDAAEASVFSSDRALSRFANNVIHQNVAAGSETLCLRAVRGQRTGCVRTGVLSGPGVAAAAEKAAAIAAAAAEDPEFPGLAECPTAEPCGVFDRAAADCTPARRAAAVRDIISRVESAGATSSGSLQTGAGSSAFANTAGTRQFDRRTDVRLNVVAMADSAAGRATFAANRLDEMDADERSQAALDKCLGSRGAREIEPGEYTVVLEPPAVADLVRFLGYLGFNAMRMQQGRSPLQGKLGTRVCDERITLVDDARDPAGLPFSFDYEGVPKRRVELIANGIAKTVVYDLRTAAKDGVESTGHGNLAPASGGAFPGNIIMSPGDVTEAEMIASTDRGLLVSNFHYTNVAEPSTCTITGMTRYGLFEIVDGEIAGPVRNLRFTESVLRALKNIDAVGSDRRRQGSTVCPALKISGFRFTGKSDH
jgi:predicted Zn-dependent protease